MRQNYENVSFFFSNTYNMICNKKLSTHYQYFTLEYSLMYNCVCLEHRWSTYTRFYFTFSIITEYDKSFKTIITSGKETICSRATLVDNLNEISRPRKSSTNCPKIFLLENDEKAKRVDLHCQQMTVMLMAYSTALDSDRISLKSQSSHYYIHCLGIIYNLHL